MDRESFVIKEVAKLPTSLPATPGKHIKVLCPFHADSDPSGDINLKSDKVSTKGHKVGVGYFSCWSCKAHGNWNYYAEKTGLAQIVNGEFQEEEFSHRRIPKKQVEALTVMQAMHAVNVFIWEPFATYSKKRWRGFSKTYLKQYEAYFGDFLGGEPCLAFIVRNRENEVIGSFGAFLDPDKDKKELSFLNASGQWIKDYGLWPMSQLPRGEIKVVWLVEGQRDALRLCRLGLPALCIFGTNNWSDTKRDMVLALGVDRVILMMDGDEAGIKATNEIAPTLRKFVDVKICKLGKDAEQLGLDKLDPNDAPLAVINNYYKKFGMGFRINNAKNKIKEHAGQEYVSCQD